MSPRYRYLTRDYVEWLGLEIVPLTKRHRGHIFMPNGCLPAPSSSGWVEGVIFEGYAYERMLWDSFDLTGARHSGAYAQA
jgi:hypothetical protein